MGILKDILFVLLAGGAAFSGAWLALSKRKFTAKIGKQDEIILEPQKKGKVEFLEEATEQELKEMEQPKLTKFLKQFKRNGKT